MSLTIALHTPRQPCAMLRNNMLYLSRTHRRVRSLRDSSPEKPQTSLYRRIGTSKIARSHGHWKHEETA